MAEKKSSTSFQRSEAEYRDAAAVVDLSDLAMVRRHISTANPREWPKPLLYALTEEVERLREILVFAEGGVKVGMRYALADLYAEDCEWAQSVLRRAGCFPRKIPQDHAE
jgi:hypothetical protein